MTWSFIFILVKIVFLNEPCNLAKILKPRLLFLRIYLICQNVAVKHPPWNYFRQQELTGGAPGPGVRPGCAHSLELGVSVFSTVRRAPSGCSAPFLRPHMWRGGGVHTQACRRAGPLDLGPFLVHSPRPLFSSSPVKPHGKHIKGRDFVKNNFWSNFQGKLFH